MLSQSYSELCLCLKVNFLELLRQSFPQTQCQSCCPTNSIKTLRMTDFLIGDRIPPPRCHDCSETLRCVHVVCIAFKKSHSLNFFLQFTIAIPASSFESLKVKCLGCKKDIRSEVQKIDHSKLLVSSHNIHKSVLYSDVKFSFKL